MVAKLKIDIAELNRYLSQPWFSDVGWILGKRSKFEVPPVTRRNTSLLPSSSPKGGPEISGHKGRRSSGGTFCSDFRAYVE